VQLYGSEFTGLLHFDEVLVNAELLLVDETPWIYSWREVGEKKQPVEEKCHKILISFSQP